MLRPYPQNRGALSRHSHRVVIPRSPVSSGDEESAVGRLRVRKADPSSAEKRLARDDTVSLRGGAKPRSCDGRSILRPYPQNRGALSRHSHRVVIPRSPVSSGDEESAVGRLRVRKADPSSAEKRLARDDTVSLRGGAKPRSCDGRSILRPYPQNRGALSRHSHRVVIPRSPVSSGDEESAVGRLRVRKADPSSAEKRLARDDTVSLRGGAKPRSCDGRSILRPYPQNRGALSRHSHRVVIPRSPVSSGDEESAVGRLRVRKADPSSAEKRLARDDTVSLRGGAKPRSCDGRSILRPYPQNRGALSRHSHRVVIPRSPVSSGDEESAVGRLRVRKADPSSAEKRLARDDTVSLRGGAKPRSCDGRSILRPYPQNRGALSRHSHRVVIPRSPVSSGDEESAVGRLRVRKADPSSAEKRLARDDTVSLRGGAKPRSCDGRSILRPYPQNRGALSRHSHRVVIPRSPVSSGDEESAVGRLRVRKADPSSAEKRLARDDTVSLRGGAKPRSCDGRSILRPYPQNRGALSRHSHRVVIPRSPVSSGDEESAVGRLRVRKADPSSAEKRLARDDTVSLRGGAKPRSCDGRSILRPYPQNRGALSRHSHRVVIPRSPVSSGDEESAVGRLRVRKADPSSAEKRLARDDTVSLRGGAKPRSCDGRSILRPYPQNRGALSRHSHRVVIPRSPVSSGDEESAVGRLRVRKADPSSAEKRLARDDTVSLRGGAKPRSCDGRSILRPYPQNRGALSRHSHRVVIPRSPVSSGDEESAVGRLRVRKADPSSAEKRLARDDTVSLRGGAKPRSCDGRSILRPYPQNRGALSRHSHRVVIPRSPVSSGDEESAVGRLRVRKADPSSAEKRLARDDTVSLRGGAKPRSCDGRSILRPYPQNRGALSRHSHRVVIPRSPVSSGDEESAVGRLRVRKADPSSAEKRLARDDTVSLRGGAKPRSCDGRSILRPYPQNRGALSRHSHRVVIPRSPVSSGDEESAVGRLRVRKADPSSAEKRLARDDTVSLRGGAKPRSCDGRSILRPYPQNRGALSRHSHRVVIPRSPVSSGDEESAVGRLRVRKADPSSAEKRLARDDTVSLRGGAKPRSCDGRSILRPYPQNRGALSRHSHRVVIPRSPVSSGDEESAVGRLRVRKADPSSAEKRLARDDTVSLRGGAKPRSCDGRSILRPYPQNRGALSRHSHRVVIPRSPVSSGDEESAVGRLRVRKADPSSAEKRLARDDTVSLRGGAKPRSCDGRSILRPYPQNRGALSRHSHRVVIPRSPVSSGDEESAVGRLRVRKADPSSAEKRLARDDTVSLRGGAKPRSCDGRSILRPYPQNRGALSRHSHRVVIPRSPVSSGDEESAVGRLRVRKADPSSAEKRLARDDTVSLRGGAKPRSCDGRSILRPYPQNRGALSRHSHRVVIPRSPVSSGDEESAVGRLRVRKADPSSAEKRLARDDTVSLRGGAKPRSCDGRSILRPYPQNRGALSRHSHRVVIPRSPVSSGDEESAVGRLRVRKADPSSAEKRLARDDTVSLRGGAKPRSCDGRSILRPYPQNRGALSRHSHRVVIPRSPVSSGDEESAVGRLRVRKADPSSAEKRLARDDTVSLRGGAKPRSCDGRSILRPYPQNRGALSRHSHRVVIPRSPVSSGDEESAVGRLRVRKADPSSAEKRLARDDTVSLRGGAKPRSCDGRSILRPYPQNRGALSRHSHRVVIPRSPVSSGDEESAVGRLRVRKADPSSAEKRLARDDTVSLRGGAKPRSCDGRSILRPYPQNRGALSRHSHRVVIPRSPVSSGDEESAVGRLRVRKADPSSAEKRLARDDTVSLRGGAKPRSCDGRSILRPYPQNRGALSRHSHRVVIPRSPVSSGDEESAVGRLRVRKADPSSAEKRLARDDTVSLRGGAKPRSCDGRSILRPYPQNRGALSRHSHRVVIPRSPVSSGDEESAVGRLRVRKADPSSAEKRLARDDTVSLRGGAKPRSCDGRSILRPYPQNRGALSRHSHRVVIPRSPVSSGDEESAVGRLRVRKADPSSAEKRLARDDTVSLRGGAKPRSCDGRSILRPYPQNRGALSRHSHRVVIPRSPVSSGDEESAVGRLRVRKADPSSAEKRLARDDTVSLRGGAKPRSCDGRSILRPYPQNRGALSRHSHRVVIPRSPVSSGDEESAVGRLRVRKADPSSAEKRLARDDTVSLRGGAKPRSCDGRSILRPYPQNRGALSRHSHRVVIPRSPVSSGDEESAVGRLRVRKADPSSAEKRLARDDTVSLRGGAKPRSCDGRSILRPYPQNRGALSRHSHRVVIPRSPVSSGDEESAVGRLRVRKADPSSAEKRLARDDTVSLRGGAKPRSCGGRSMLRPYPQN